MRTQIQTQIRSLSSLLENLREGIIQVPPFQRDFVWDRSKVKDLFDSIRKSYPIGSILLWRPRETPVWKKNREVGSFTIPNTGEPKSYVLDGCQRLSSLFGCLTNPITSGLVCNEKRRKEYFDLHFDLKDDSFVFPNGVPKPYQVPVYILTSTSEFRQYTRNILEPAIPASDELDHYLDRADAFSRTLVDYKLAVIEVDRASLDDALNIFSRINSRGTEITYDWMVNALSFREDFNFSYEVDSVLQELDQFNFSAISRNTIFRCYQSAFDDNIYFDTDIEILAKRNDFIETSRKMSQAIIKAIEFLYTKLNVLDIRLLPYTSQLVFLSVFFMHKPQPSKEQIDDLKRWFWITTYSNYFTIQSLSGQRNAFDHFLNYIKGETSSPLYTESIDSTFVTMPWPRLFRLSSVRCKALALFQLKHQQSQLSIHTKDKKMIIRKLFRNQGSFPENMIISFTGIEKTHNYEELVFMPPYSFNEMEDLKKRRELLMSAEKKLVESFDIIYHE